MTVSESGIDGDYPREYVIIREQHKNKEHLVAGGSVAEWSKALVLGTSHSMAWVRIPPLPVCGLFTALTCETCNAFSLKVLCEIWQVVQWQLL